jgi:TrpR family transcriptional regulator, trp operon repressor
MTTFNDVIKLVHSTRDEQLLEDFLLALTTPHERRVLARRVEIVKRLVAGNTQHEIAGDLHIGVSTVTRGARELGQGRFKILKNERIVT